jgi:hypothetical protein
MQYFNFKIYFQEKVILITRPTLFNILKLTNLFINLVDISNLKTSYSFSDTIIPQSSSASSLNELNATEPKESQMVPKNVIETCELQELRNKISQLESQIESNSQGLYLTFSISVDLNVRLINLKIISFNFNQSLMI